MLTVSEKPTANIELIPPGVYVANCYGVIDLGTLENKVYGGEAHKVLIQWELPECRGEFERDGETVNLPRVISKRYTLSLSEMAKLRSDLQSWRGARPFTPDELRGFDLKAILETPCQLQIAHETSREGRSFASVAAIMALPKGTPRPGKLENPIAFFSFEEVVDKPELPDVPHWIQNIITESNEWRQAMRNEQPVQAESISKQDAQAKPEEEDNDVPF